MGSFPNKYKWKQIAATGTHGTENHFSHIPTDGSQFNPIPRTSHTPATNIPHASTAEASNFVELYSDYLFFPLEPALKDWKKRLLIQIHRHQCKATRMENQENMTIPKEQN